MAHLETELEQSRLRETETLGALREMQDKVLDMEKVRLGGRWGHPGDGAVRAPLGGDHRALAKDKGGSPKDLRARPWSQSPSPASSPIVSTARYVPLKPRRRTHTHTHTQQQHDSVRATPALICQTSGQQHSSCHGPPGQPILPVYVPLRP